MAAHTPPRLARSSPALPRHAGPFFATPEQRTERARELFFDEGQRPSGLVPEWVIQSWVRCSGAHRRPNEAIEFEPVTRSSVHSALGRNRLLLQAASDNLSQLDAALAGTPCKALLISADGIIIQATPTARGEGRIMPAIARVGVCTSERLIGTSAPSVAARTGQACLVRGAEHFFAGISLMQCAAAPIRHARGDLAGVLDLSCEGQPFRFDGAAMVHLYATAIENRLFEVQSAELLLLRFQSSPALLKTPLEGLAAVDGQGRVAWLNQTGADLLGTDRVPEPPTDIETLFGTGLEQALQLAHRGQPQVQQLPNGLCLWIQAERGAAQRSLATWTRPSAEPATDAASETAPVSVSVPVSVPQSLQTASRALIEQTLVDCAGNVTKAARRLGVSRGLLYRRMAEWRMAAAATPPPA